MQKTLKTKKYIEFQTEIKHKQESKISSYNKLIEVELNYGKVEKDNNTDKKVVEGIEATETSEGVEGVELKQHLKTVERKHTMENFIYLKSQ